MDKIVTLKQTTKYRWHLVSPKDKVMMDDLVFDSKVTAETWIRAYVSSWHDWNYKIVSLKEEK